MTIPIDYALKVLNNEFKEVIKIFQTDTWKFYKFGQDGPYKRHLTKLTQMSNEYDPVIYDRFGIHEDNASFNKLIVLCLDSAKDAKKEHKNVSTFKRQLKRMGDQL
jgi:hypothetical protein